MAIDAIVPRWTPDDDAPANPDLASLLALSVAPGSRVLVIGGANVVGLDARMSGRGAACTDAATVDEAVAAGGSFDAIVLADGFETLGDPVAALEGVGRLLTADGRLVLAAKNAASARARASMLTGADATDDVVPPRQYDLAALQRVLVGAGLAVRTCLRVLDLDPIDAPGLGRDTLSALLDGPEARATAYVVVVTRPEVAGQSSDSLEELLQRQIDGVARKLARATADLGSFEQERKDLEAKLNAAQRELDAALAENADQQRELAARAEALTERIELVERLHRERRHLELDVAVKDDYIVDLRLEFTDMLNQYNALLWKHEALLRSRHYKIAKLLHRAVRQVPLVHRIAQWTTNRGMRLARHVRPTPPTEE